MDIHDYALKLHSFLEEKALLKYILPNNSYSLSSELLWCFNNIKRAIENENIIRSTIEPIYVISQDNPIDFTSHPGKEVKPEELFKLVILKNDNLMNKLLGRYIDFYSIENDWRLLVSKTEQQKPAFKSIW